MRKVFAASAVAAATLAGAIAVPVAAAPVSPHPPKCNPHNKGAMAVSGKLVGHKAVIRAKIGHERCGGEGTYLKLGKKIVHLTVTTNAKVLVLKNGDSNQDSRVPTSRLPHYVNRGIAKGDGQQFYWAGSGHHVTKFEQIFVS